MSRVAQFHWRRVQPVQEFRVHMWKVEKLTPDWICGDVFNLIAEINAIADTVLMKPRLPHFRD